MSLGEDRDTKQLSGFQKMESPRLGTLVVWVANDGIPSFGNLGTRVAGIFFFLFPGKPPSYHLLAALKLTITKNTLSAFLVPKHHC